MPAAQTNKKIEPPFDFGRNAIKWGSLSVSRFNEDYYNILALHTFIAEGGDLNRTVKFGDQSPIKIHDIVFDMTNADDISYFIHKIKKDGIEKKQDHHILKTFLPTFFIMPRCADFIAQNQDSNLGEIIFPDVTAVTSFDTKSLRLIMEGREHEKSKTHTGHLVVASHHFNLESHLMEVYDLRVEKPYHYFPTLNDGRKINALQNKFT